MITTSEHITRNGLDCIKHTTTGGTVYEYGPHDFVIYSAHGFHAGTRRSLSAALTLALR
jgi:hypothetical protein